MITIVWHFYWGDISKHLFTSERELKTDQRNGTAEVQFMLAFIGLLTDMGTTQRQMHH